MQWPQPSVVLTWALDVQRGAHTFFLRMSKVPRWGGYTVNLIHYEDAARLAAAVSRCPSYRFLDYSQTWFHCLLLERQD